MALIEIFWAAIWAIAACCSSRSIWFLPRTLSSEGRGGLGSSGIPFSGRSVVPLTGLFTLSG